MAEKCTLRCQETVLIPMRGIPFHRRTIYSWCFDTQGIPHSPPFQFFPSEHPFEGPYSFCKRFHRSHLIIPLAICSEEIQYYYHQVLYGAFHWHCNHLKNLLTTFNSGMGWGFLHAMHIHRKGQRSEAFARELFRPFSSSFVQWEESRWKKKLWYLPQFQILWLKSLALHFIILMH